MMSFLNSKSFGMHLNYFLVLTIFFCAAFVQFSTSSAIFSVPSDEHGEFYDVELGSQLCTGACNAVNTYNDKNSSRPLEEEIDIIEEMFYFLNLGTAKIQQYSNITDVVLFVGLTGTGKTTLLQFIANETNRLYSEKDGFQYIIKDDGGVLGNFSLVSQTFLPNVMVDKDTGVAVWDCPGFNDNRNVSVEIANAFYIKTIADVAERIKIVAVVSHDTYEGRNMIEPLFKGLTALLRNPKSYLGSISIINTKTPTEMEQAEILETYVDLLSGEVKDYIDNEFTTDVGIREAAQDILSSFLMGGSPDNKLLGYFAKVTSQGYLDEMPLFVENQILLDNLLERTSFSHSVKEDFGYSLKDEAILVIVSLGFNITSEIKGLIADFATATTEYLQTQSIDVLSGFEEDITSYNTSMLAVKNTNFTLIYNTPNLDPSKYVDELVRNIESFKLQISAPVLLRLTKLGKYLDFLASASENVLPYIVPQDWVAPLEFITVNVSNFISDKVVSIAEDQIAVKFQEFASDVEVVLNNEFVYFLNLSRCSNQVMRSAIAGLKAADYSFAVNHSSSSPMEYLELITMNIDKFGSPIGLQTPQSVYYLVRCLEIFQSASPSQITLRVDKWVVPLQQIEQNVINAVETEVVPFVLERTYQGLIVLSQSVQTQLPQQIAGSEDVSLIINQLDEVRNTLKSKLNNTLSISNFLDVTINSYVTLNLSFTLEETEHFLRTTDCLDSLQILSNFNWASRLEWLDAHDSIYITLKEIKFFFEFLDSLFQDLSTFDFQSKRQGALDSWWTSKRPVTSAKISEFWGKFKEAKVSAVVYGNQTVIMEMLNSQGNLNNLNLVLETALGDNFVCPPVVSGLVTYEQNFLSLQHVINCSSKKPTNQVVVKVFHTFFVDVDLAGADIDESKNLDLFVMASKWFIRDNKIINLDGLSGSGGTPGHAAGNLFAVTQGFEDGKLDFSSFNGGSGSNGKDGNDGEHGTSGSIKSFSPVSDCDAWSGGSIRITIYPNTCNNDNNGRCHADDDGVRVDIYGTPGSAGGNGGQGTNAGAGGVHGQGDIVDVSPNGGVISTVGVNGKDGITGKGGAGGLGGKNGDTRWVLVDDVPNGSQKVCVQKGSGITSVTTRKEDGYKGNDGILVPTTRTDNPFVKGKYLTYVADYKTNARKLSTTNSFLRAQLVQFLDLVDQNPNLKP